jgi:hypothetical protein
MLPTFWRGFLPALLACVLAACARPAVPVTSPVASPDDLDPEPGLDAASESAAAGGDVVARVSLAPRYPGDVLLVLDAGAEEIMECRRHDLALRLVRDGQMVAEAVLEGACQGACTPEDKAAGEQALADATARVAAGETESVLDYDFTGCIFHGTEYGRVERVAGRAFVLLSGATPGPHDIPGTHYRLATALCDRVFVSQPFGSTYAPRWALSELHVTTGSDGAVIVTGMDADTGGGARVELYRVTFPADDCASPPVEQVGDAEG